MSRRRVLAAIGIAGVGSVARLVGANRRFSQRLLAAADPIARRAGTYTAYQLSIEEYVGRVPLERGDTGLTDRSYQMNALSAAKYHPVTASLDDRSLRRVDPENPRWQWHVHLWLDDDAAELYSHYELRPDLNPIGDETIDEVVDRIRSHYKPKWDTRYDAEEATYFLGRACEEVHETVTTT